MNEKVMPMDTSETSSETYTEHLQINCQASLQAQQSPVVVSKNMVYVIITYCVCEINLGFPITRESCAAHLKIHEFFLITGIA